MEGRGGEHVRHDFQTRKTGVNCSLREISDAKAEHMVWGLTGNLWCQRRHLELTLWAVESH